MYNTTNPPVFACRPWTSWSSWGRSSPTPYTPWYGAWTLCGPWSAWPSAVRAARPACSPCVPSAASAVPARLSSSWRSVAGSISCADSWSQVCEIKILCSSRRAGQNDVIKSTFLRNTAYPFSYVPCSPLSLLYMYTIQYYNILYLFYKTW